MALSALTLASIAISMTGGGCEVVPIVSEKRHFTSTVTLSSEANLIVDMPLSVEINAAPVRTSVLADFDGTITASTSTRAKTVAEGLAFIVTRPDAQTVKISLPAPLIGTNYTLKLIAGSSRIVLIKSWRGAIVAAAQSGVQVDDGCCAITITQAPQVVVATSLQAGAPVDITASGQVDLILPERPSIALTVSVNDNNQLSILHPLFPRPIGGVPYAPVLNGGLAPVRVLTQTGRIVIRSAAK
jgi:hypothetical protein